MFDGMVGGTVRWWYVYSWCRSTGFHMRGESFKNFSDVAWHCEGDGVGNSIEVYRESDVRRAFPINGDGVQELKG